MTQHERPITDQGRLTLSIPSACRLLGISRGLGYELARTGQFPVPVLKLGRRLLVSRIALLRLLAVSEANGASN